MKWVLSTMMAGLSLFMLFTIYTMNANFSRIDNSIQELVQAQKEHNDLYKHQEKVAQLAIKHNG